MIKYEVFYFLNDFDQITRDARLIRFTTGYDSLTFYYCHIFFNRVFLFHHLLARAKIANTLENVIEDICSKLCHEKNVFWKC